MNALGKTIFCGILLSWLLLLPNVSPAQASDARKKQEPNALQRLKPTAHLTPVVKVRRSGNHLSLSYKLQDASGQIRPTHSKAIPPQFAIYIGDKKIDSGAFKYG